MKITYALAALALLATPALADQKLDEAMAKAEDQLQKGKTDEALKTAQKFADQNASSVEARLFLGRIQERLGLLDEAAATITKAVEMAASAPPNVRAQAYAARAMIELKRGSGRDAVAHAQEAVKADASAVALAALAHAEARVGAGAKALEAAEKAVQAAATSAIAHEAKGAALLALHKGEEAAAEFRKALELDPKLHRARVGLAQAQLVAGKAAEAEAEARKATTADDKSAEAFAVLGAAILAVNPNNWNDAIAQAQQGAFLNPKSAIVQTIVGKIFEAAGNLDQAASSYKRATEVDPGNVQAQSALISVQVRKGDIDGALAAAKKLVAEAPQSGEAQLQLGRALLRKNEFAEAVEALQKATELAPGIGEAHALLGTAYQYTRRTPEAVAEYKEATRLAPDNVDYKTTYGLLLGMTGEPEACIAMLNKVVATPNYKKPDAYMNLGWCYRNTKPAKTDESVAAYKKALAIDPKNAQAYLGMGWAYSYTRRWDECIGTFKKTIEMDPSLAGEANDGIAWCYFFKKEMPQAKEYLGKAQAAGRNDTRLKENIEKIERLIAAGKARETEEELRKTEGPKMEEGPDLPSLVEKSKSRDANARLRAAKDMAATGAAGAPYLGYIAQTDSDIGVREAAVKSLSAMGCAAKGAIPQLREVAAQRSIPNPDASKAEMQMELREEDLRKAVRAVLEKLAKC